MTIEHIAYAVTGLFVLWGVFMMGRSWQAIQESNKRIRQLDKDIAYGQGRIDAYSEAIKLLNRRTGDDE
jgi:hypothetical protein